MTNITREQVERQINDFESSLKNLGHKLNGTSAASIAYDANIEKQFLLLKICTLALRALDTPSVEEIEAKAYERAATIAKEHAFFCSQQAEDCPLSRRSSWLESSKTLADFATAIRALSPSTIRYVELPDGHVVVPVEPTVEMIRAGDGTGVQWLLLALDCEDRKTKEFAMKTIHS